MEPGSPANVLDGIASVGLRYTAPIGTLESNGLEFNGVGDGYIDAFLTGAQFFGKATILDVGTPEWEHGMKVFKWAGSSSELGRALIEPPQGQLMRMDPDRIVYSEHLMRKQGYAPRQIWLRDSDENLVVPGRNV